VEERKGIVHPVMKKAETPRRDKVKNWYIEIFLEIFFGILLFNTIFQIK
jgi:hypothetical protein